MLRAINLSAVICERRQKSEPVNRLDISLHRDCERQPSASSRIGSHESQMVLVHACDFRITRLSFLGEPDSTNGWKAPPSGLSVVQPGLYRRFKHR